MRGHFVIISPFRGYDDEFSRKLAALSCASFVLIFLTLLTSFLLLFSYFLF